MAITETLNIAPTNKVIIVTGGYGYLGKAMCASLIYNGAIVYVAARNENKYKETFKDELARHGTKLNFLFCDINSTESLNKCFAKVFENEGRIDGLINNAFSSRGQSPSEMNRDDFNFTLNGTLASVFDSIKLIIPYLTEGGSIVNISSMYGMVAPDFSVYEKSPKFLNPPHYGAAKAGVIQLTKYYASFLGDKGVRVNAVSPGPFPSESVRDDTTFVEELEKRTLLKRIGFPEELAGVFTFLMSDAAKYITGQNFVIDGGWTTI